MLHIRKIMLPEKKTLETAPVGLAKATTRQLLVASMSSGLILRETAPLSPCEKM